MKKLSTVVLLCLCVVVRGNLICYDCNPTSTEKCISPSQENVKTTVCDDINSESSLPQTRPQCFTLQYIKGDDCSKTGIYRGCTSQVRGDTCAHLNRTYEGGITWCKTCTSNRCNL